MQRLILNFLARWRWVLAFCAAFTGISAALGFPSTLAPVVVICLLFDAGRGVFRTAAPLPLTRREQALAWWLIAVVVVPVLWLVPLGAGALFHHRPGSPLLPESDGQLVLAAMAGAPGNSIWFAVAVQAWIGLGACALLYLYATVLPTRGATGLAENIKQGVIGAFWGLMTPGLMVLVPALPRSPENLAPWHWVVFAAVPVLVVLSFFSSPELVRRRMVVPTGMRRARTSEERIEEKRGASGGFCGVPLFLATYAGRTALMLLVFALVQTTVLWWITGRKSLAPSPSGGFVGPMQFAMFALIFAGFSGEWLNLRTLRTLPLTTWQLAALIVAAPVSTGLLGAIFICLSSGMGVNPLMGVANFAGQILWVAGFGTLTLALMLQFTSGLRFVILILATEAPAFTDAWLFGKAPVWIALIGAFAFAFALFLILRGLHRSTAFYRPRGWFGLGIGMALSPR
jgi:hypothetical protein